MVSLSSCRDSHPATSYQLAWRSHLSAKGRRHDKVPESGLKQRFFTVARHYEITVEKAGANATAVRFSHRRQGR